VVEWNGKPVKSIRKGFAAAVKASGVTANYPITPHLFATPTGVVTRR
jgi:hypothetical protein